MSLMNKGKDKKREKDKKKDETKREFDFNKAIVAGKKVWRGHTTTMQAFGDIPTLIDNDILELDKTIKDFGADGGMITYDETTSTWDCSYKNVDIKIIFDHTGRKKFHTITDKNHGKTPKNIIKTIGDVIAAHHELSKRLFAKKAMNEIIEYLEDNAAKDSIETLLELFKDNGEVIWRAINGDYEAFDVNINEYLERAE